MAAAALLSVATLSYSSTDLASLISQCVRPTSYLCSPSDKRRIERACAELELSSERPAWPRDLMRLDGKWRLLFSSTLAGPTPPNGLLEALPDPPESVLAALESAPFAPRAVRQEVDVMRRRVINVVTLSPWPSGMVGSMLSGIGGPFGDLIAELQSAQVTLELDHSFTAEGDGSSGRRQAASGSTITLTLEEVRRALDGDNVSPGQGSAVGSIFPLNSRFQLPTELRPLAAGEFQTTFCDSALRISRGVPRFPNAPAELRVFAREEEEESWSSWQEEEDAKTQASTAAAAEVLREDPVEDDPFENYFDEMPD